MGCLVQMDVLTDTVVVRKPLQKVLEPCIWVQGAYEDMTGVLFWDVLLNVCKKKKTSVWDIYTSVHQSNTESGSCLFQISAIQVLHIFCYIMGRVFYTSQASQYLNIVSN